MIQTLFPKDKLANLIQLSVNKVLEYIANGKDNVGKIYNSITWKISFSEVFK